MNEYFSSIIKRCNKIADLPIDEYKGTLMIRLNDVVSIVEDENDIYKRNLWNPLWKKEYPWNKYGESSRPVLVRLKAKNSDPIVCTYNFAKKNFVFMDNDITNSIKEWCEIPGYGYDE